MVVGYGGAVHYEGSSLIEARSVADVNEGSVVMQLFGRDWKQVYPQERSSYVAWTLGPPDDYDSGD